MNSIPWFVRVGDIGERFYEGIRLVSYGEEYGYKERAFFLICTNGVFLFILKYRFN